MAKELIFLGDGADWIWNLVAEHFPKAIQILDWFHASEHLMPVAQAAFAAVDEQNAWVASMKQQMWDGQIDQLISHCRHLASGCEAKVIGTTATYFENHRERMRYDYFRSQGYQIGSGTIESAAKQVGLMRMKVPGASWNLENARKVPGKWLKQEPLIFPMAGNLCPSPHDSYVYLPDIPFMHPFQK